MSLDDAGYTTVVYRVQTPVPMPIKKECEDRVLQYPLQWRHCNF